MPPPVSRPTITSAARASFVDEQLRQKKVAEKTYTNFLKKGSKVCGVPVARVVASKPTQTDFVSQGRRDEPVAGWDRDRDKRGFETGARSDRGSGNYSRGKSDQEYYPDRYRERNDPSGGDSATRHSLGIFPRSFKMGSLQKRQDNSKRDDKLTGATWSSSGQSSSGDKGKDSQNSQDISNKDRQKKGAAGTSSEHRSSVAKDQVHTYHRSTIVSDPYGYTVLAQSEEKHNRNNLDFYRNKIPSKPIQGHTIEDMLKWKGDFGMLERNHQYIQWLFPIPEGKGLNIYAQQLFEHEAKAIRDDDLTHKRVLKAYEMMLDFYGMQLVSSVDGSVKRATKGWRERYAHLNRSFHNYYRITRILKSIGELGYERMQAPWVNFLIEEAMIKKELPNLNGPCLMHWVMAVKDIGEREMLYRKARGLPINQENVTHVGGSESEGEDDKSDSDKLDYLDHHDTGQARVSSESEQILKEQNPVKNVIKNKTQTSSAVTNDAADMEASSLPKQKDEKHDENHDKYKTSQDEKLESSSLKFESGKNVGKMVEGGKVDKLVKQDKSGKLSAATGNDKGTDTSVRKKEMKTTQWHVDIQQRGYEKISATEAKMYQDNLKFYQNKIRSKPPPGNTIKEMLKWKGDYDMLERNHKYIQWLFPIPEGSGLNISAQQLYEHEAQAIRDDKDAHKRVLIAFKMMLDFYGMQLTDSDHGVYQRLSKGWEDRYFHLNRSRHNLLRITRILKSIGELGYERLQAPWVSFLIDEAVVEGLLPNLKHGCFTHWIDAVTDDAKREALYAKAFGQDINIESTMPYANSESEGEEDEGITSQNIEPTKDALSELSLEDDKKKVKLEAHSHTSNVSDPAMPFMENSNRQEGNANNRSSISSKDHNESVFAELKADSKLQECQQPCANLTFYQNMTHSKPLPGFTIETMLRYQGEYNFFEEYPGFIQWLFPTPEQSFSNPEAQPLQPYEAEEIRNNDKLMSRFLQAYIMILDFFGLRLTDENSGNVEHIPDKYKQRYRHLEKNRHNYTRITRIITSLGELGCERFQVPLIKLFIKDGIERKRLNNIKGTYVMEWISSIKDEAERQAMFSKYQRYAGHNADIESEEEEEGASPRGHNDFSDPTCITG